MRACVRPCGLDMGQPMDRAMVRLRPLITAAIMQPLTLTAIRTTGVRQFTLGLADVGATADVGANGTPLLARSS